MEVTVITGLFAKWNVNIYSPAQPPRRGGAETGQVLFHLKLFFFKSIIKFFPPLGVRGLLSFTKASQPV